MADLSELRDYTKEQLAIEAEVGIDSDEIARYMMESSSTHAKNAYRLYAMQVYHRDNAGIALLKAAINSCKEEMRK